MIICRAALAAVVLGLCTPEIEGEPQISLEEREGVLSLVQISLEGFEANEWPSGGPLVPKRRERRNNFPLTDNKHNISSHFVGSGAFSMEIMGYHVHCYDVAMYLDEASSVWDTLTIRNRDKRIEAMLDGGVFLDIIARSKWTSKKNVALFVDRLEHVAEEDGMYDYKADIKRYKQAFLHGPKVSQGSRIVLLLSREGVRPIIAGHDVGLVKSWILAKLVMKAYLGPKSDLPLFRERVFAQLSDGKPEAVTPLSDDRMHVASVWGVIILAIALVAVLTCFIYGLFCCRCCCCWIPK